MQVLVKNPFSESRLVPKNVIESFWSPDCLYLDAKFSMSSLTGPSDSVGLSPFLVLDAKIAFLISQLNAVATTYARSLGPLGLVGASILIGAKIVHEEDQKKVSRYLEEYVPRENQSITPDTKSYDQIVVFGGTRIDQNLWKQLNVGGYYLVASDKSAIEIDLEQEKFEAFGKLWPFGESTEFGWRFKEDQWGFTQYEFAKIRKLS
jgi:hypothetical protein